MIHINNLERLGCGKLPLKNYSIIWWKNLKKREIWNSGGIVPRVIDILTLNFCRPKFKTTNDHSFSLWNRTDLRIWPPLFVPVRMTRRRTNTWAVRRCDLPCSRAFLVKLAKVPFSNYMLCKYACNVCILETRITDTIRPPEYFVKSEFRVLFFCFCLYNYGACARRRDRLSLRAHTHIVLERHSLMMIIRIINVKVFRRVSPPRT